MYVLTRLKKTNGEYLSSVSSADLFLVSMMVASKYLHDDGEEDEVFNDEWAASGDIDIKVITSVVDPDPDPVGSGTFCRIRSRIRNKSFRIRIRPIRIRNEFYP